MRDHGFVRLDTLAGLLVAAGGALGSGMNPGSTWLTVAYVFCAGLAGAAAAILIVRKGGAST